MDRREQDVRGVIAKALYGSWGNDHERDHHAPGDVFRALLDAGWLRDEAAPRYSIEVIPLTQPFGGYYRVMDGDFCVAITPAARDAEVFVDYLKKYGGSNEGR